MSTDSSRGYRDRPILRCCANCLYCVHRYGRTWCTLEDFGQVAAAGLCERYLQAAAEEQRRLPV